MKNELNAEEWLAVAEYLMYGVKAFKRWKNNGLFDKKYGYYKSAQKKIRNVALEVREQRGGGLDWLN